MPVGVKAKTLAARDLEGGFIGVCLDLDGAVVGVVVAKGGGGEDEEESKEGDEEGEVELEGDGVVVGFGWVAIVAHAQRWIWVVMVHTCNDWAWTRVIASLLH